MINIPTFLVQQAQRRLANIRAHIVSYRDEAENYKSRVVDCERSIAECERDEAELTTFLVQIGVPVPQGEPADRPAAQEAR